MTSRTLVAAGTGAATGDFRVIPGQVATIFAVGLAGAETVQLSISGDEGSNWQLVKYAGSTVQLDVNNTLLKIDAPGYYRASKSVTAASVPVYQNDQYRT